MMIIKTKYHGETQIQEDQTIVFKNGLPGFTGEKKFVQDSIIFTTFRKSSLT